MRAFLLLSLVGISAMISQVAGRRQRPNRPTEVTLTVGGEVLTYTCRTQCPPQQFDTTRLEALAPGKVCSDTGETFQNLCKMLKKKCRGHQLEFASSGRCVRRDCKKKCGKEGPEVCVSNSNKRFTNRCRFEKANCLRGPERALTEIPCPTGATGAPPALLVNGRNQEVFIPGHRGEQEEIEVEESEVEEPETEGAPPFNVPAPAPLIKEPAKQEVFLPFPTDLPPDAGVEGGSELPEGSEVEEPEEDSSEEEEEEEEGGSEVASEVSEAQPQGGSDYESQAGPSPSEYEVEEEEEESEED